MRREEHARPARHSKPAGFADTGYHEYDLFLRESPPRALGITQQVLGIVVRVLGLCFLLIGIGAAVMILREAWMLYQDPARIERFALAIERGSNLDKIFIPTAGESFPAGAQGGTADATLGETGPQPAASSPEGAENLRMSYFAGWFLVLLLMVVASITAISAVSAGGRLVLYDIDVRRLSRAVIKEIRRSKGD